jgi:hypothetical protein
MLFITFGAENGCGFMQKTLPASSAQAPERKGSCFFFIKCEEHRGMHFMKMYEVPVSPSTVSEGARAGKNSPKKQGV